MDSTNEIDDILQETSQQHGSGLSLGSIVLLVGVLMAVGTVGWALLNHNPGQPRSGPAPDFSLTTFDGETLRLSDFRGKVVLLNFWGSWCAPCHAEASDLQALHERYEDQGVVILGVAYLDATEDSLEFIERYNITYPNGLDVGTRISEDLYHIQGAPENFVIDQEGNIALFHLGPVTQAQMIEVFDRLLAKA